MGQQDKSQRLGKASLQGTLLIAMPSLHDHNFDHSVVLVCQHDDSHALGLVLNQPMERINFKRLVEDLDIPLDVDQSAQNRIGKTQIFRGGPVETERGFVLHSLDYQNRAGTLRFSGATDGFGLTATRDILVDIANEKGPSQSLIALGYAGWGAGQLEQELSQNAWLTAPADPQLVFTQDRSNLWQKALSSLGIRPEHLSGQTGTA